MKDYVQYIDKLYEDITLDLQNKKASVVVSLYPNRDLKIVDMDRL